MADSASLIGHTISHYGVIDKIGQGGMGVVYRARDMRLERDVALKVLPDGVLADPAARKRFRNEALALARLNHPNICSVFDFDTDGGSDFLVMEFVPGVSLHEKLHMTSPILDEVSALGLQLASGLAAAHDQGVLHRDLKPGNLRVTPDGRPQHHVPAAQEALARATALSSGSDSPRHRLQLAVCAARVNSAAGNSASELQTLQAALNDFGPKADFRVRLAARLALAEITLASSGPASARPLLEGIEKDAGEKGFVLYARKAAALRKS